MMALYAERVAVNTKIAYFKSALEKDADFYDKNIPTVMGSRIAKEVSGMQRGIGEKFGNIFMSVSSFFLSYIFSFYYGWKLTLILLGGVPFVLLTGMFVGIAAQGGIVE